LYRSTRTCLRAPRSFRDLAMAFPTPELGEKIPLYL
jgi:hypothetical protein